MLLVENPTSNPSIPGPLTDRESNPLLSWIMGPILKTERLVLRPLCRDDAPRIQVVFPDIEVTRYLAGAIPWPYPEDGAWTFLENVFPEIENGKRFIWAITERVGDGKLIGLIDLATEGPFHRGFWLVPEHRRKGYMTEAVAAVNDFAFEVVGLEKMRLSNAEPNLGSHKLKSKSGAILVEVNDDVPYVGGRFREEVWELTADQWRRNRIRFMNRERA